MRRIFCFRCSIYVKSVTSTLFDPKNRKMIRLAFLLCFLFYITIIHSQRMTQDDIYHELILKMTEVNNNLEVAERNNLEKEDEYYNSLYDEEYDLQSYQHSRIKTHTQNDVYTDNNNVNTRHHSVVEGSAENAEVNKPATDNLKNVEGDMDTTTDDHAPIANQQTSTNIVELTIHQVNGEQTLHKVDITNAGDIKNFVELLRTDTLHELNEIGEELITDTMEYVAGKKDLLMMEQECIYDKMNTAHQLVINRTRESANAGFDMVECSKIMDMDAWRANVDEKMRPYQDCYVNIIMEEYNRIREMNEFKMKITNEVSRTLRNLKLCKNRVHPNDLCIETNGKNNDIINFVEGKTRKMASAFREANAVTHLTMDKMIYTCKFLNVITEFDKPFVEFIWKINSCMKLQTSGAYTPKIHTKVDVDNKVRCSPIFAQEERRSEKIHTYAQEKTHYGPATQNVINKINAAQSKLDARIFDAVQNLVDMMKDVRKSVRITSRNSGDVMEEIVHNVIEPAKELLEKVDEKLHRLADESVDSECTKQSVEFKDKLNETIENVTQCLASQINLGSIYFRDLQIKAEDLIQELLQYKAKADGCKTNLNGIKAAVQALGCVNVTGSKTAGAVASKIPKFKNYVSEVMIHLSAIETSIAQCTVSSNILVLKSNLENFMDDEPPCDAEATNEANPSS